MNYIRQHLFVFWLAAIPFVAWRGIFEGAKVAVFWTGSIFLAIKWIFRIKTEAFEFSKKDRLFLLFIFALGISSAFGIHPADSLIGGSYRHQGVIFFFSLWLVGRSIEFIQPKYIKLLIASMGIGAIAQSILLVVQMLLKDTIPGLLTLNNRPLGTFGEANASAGFISMAAVFFLSYTLSKDKFKHKHFWLVAFTLFSLAGIIVSQSRTSLLSFLLGLILVLPTFLKKYALTRVKPFHYLLASFLSITVVISILTVFAISQKARPVSVFENRFLFWKIAVIAIKEKPLLGYGAESGEAVYELFFSKAGLPLENLIVDRAHNLILDLAVWSGLLGTASFSTWFIYELRETVKSKRFYLLPPLLAWLIFAFLQPLGITHWLFLIIALRTSKE